MDTLKGLRDHLDMLDFQICSFINERMNIIDRIGQIKREHQLPVTDQSREEEIFTHVKMAVEHPVLKESIVRIYKQMIEESRTAQKFLQYLSCPFKKVGIIGLGLMGGSICKALKLKDPSIHVATMICETEDYRLALQEGWIDSQYSSLLDLMLCSELIILATPISTVASIAKQLSLHGSQLSEQLVVIDLTSVKKGVIESIEGLSDEKMEFISTHPMAGNEKRGFANSQATLFVSRPWVIVPHEKNSSHALRQVDGLIQFFGAEPVYLEGDCHDRQTGLISHLPGVISKVFYDFVEEVDPESLKIAGPGFHSLTRLAHDNPEMREEIATYNQEMIGHYLNRWIGYLRKEKQQ
jgi:prephenate dehydrogenase